MRWIILKIFADMLSAGNSLTIKKMLSCRVSDQRLHLLSLGLLSLPFTASGLKSLASTSSGAHLWLALFSGIMYVLSGRYYYRAMAVEDASRVSLLLRSRMICILLLSIVFLQEKLTMLQYVGCGLSMAGGLIVTLERVKGRFHLGPGAQAALMCNLCGSLGFIAKAYLLRYYTFWETFSMLRVGTILGIILVLKLRGILEGGRAFSSLRLQDGSVLMAGQLVRFLSALCSTFAFSRVGSVAIMSVLSGLSPLYVKLMEIGTKHTIAWDNGLWRGVAAFTMLLGSAYLLVQ